MKALCAFDLPEWLGTDEVTWRALAAVEKQHRVPGVLSNGADEHSCDLLAVDVAWPVPVVPEPVRTEAHRAWRSGEVALLSDAGRLVLAVPGTAFGADKVLEVLERLARAVGAKPERFLAALRVGVVREAD